MAKCLHADNGVGGNTPLDIQSLAPYQVGKWQHVVVVYDPVNSSNATLTIYIDGVAANTMTYSGTDPGYAPCTDALKSLKSEGVPDSPVTPSLPLTTYPNSQSATYLLFPVARS